MGFDWRTTMINLDKLNQLRDSYEKRRDVYAGVSARARAAQAEAEAVQLRSFNPSMTATPEQRALMARALALPPAELLALPPDVLPTLGLTPAMIKRGIDAQSRADSLKREAEAMITEIHHTGALITKLTEYVRVNT